MRFPPRYLTFNFVMVYWRQLKVSKKVPHISDKRAKTRQSHLRQKVFIVTQVQSYFVCPLDLLQWVNIEDKMKLFFEGCLLSRPQDPASYPSQLKSYTATSLSSFQVLFISLFWLPPLFTVTHLMILISWFLFPLITFASVRPPLSKWNLTMRRATLESNFQIIQKKSKIKKAKNLKWRPLDDKRDYPQHSLDEKGTTRVQFSNYLEKKKNGKVTTLILSETSQSSLS